MLNAASLAAFQPVAGMATYSATKAFVLTLTRAINAEVAGTGVSLTALCPGPVPTEWAETAGVENVPEIVQVSLDVVADAAVEAMATGGDVVVPGTVPKVMAALSKIIPDGLLAKASARSLK